MKKLLIVPLIALFLAFPCSASTISDGAIVKTNVSPDIYIVKYSGSKLYKRLVLNPLVFNSYGHLKWENVLTVSQAEIDSYTTSDLVKVDGFNTVYQLVPNGDAGDKYTISGTGYDTNSVYIINDTDFKNYTQKGNRTIQIVNEGETGSTAAKEETVDSSVARKKEVSSSVSKIESLLSDIKSKIKNPEAKIVSKEKELSVLKASGNKGSVTLQKISLLASELDLLHQSYDPLKDKQNRLNTIKYEFEDYIKDGTTVPAEDRTYLDNLTEQEEAEVKAVEDSKKAAEDKESRKVEAEPIIKRINSLVDELDKKWEDYEDTEEAYTKKIRNLKDEIAVKKEGGRDTTKIQTDIDNTVKERADYVNRHSDDQHKNELLFTISVSINKYVETGTPIYQGHKKYLIENCGITNNLPTRNSLA
jgi:hypothetical protein